MNDALDLVEIFFTKAADTWYDFDGIERTGEGLFNIMATQGGIPACSLFSGGTQIAQGGAVSLFAIDPEGRTSRYGVNNSLTFNGTLLVEVMLPSGAYGKDAWKQRKVYDKILRTCLEQAFSQPEPCLSRFVIDEIDIQYMTQGGGQFSPFEALNKIENKKLAASLRVTAADWIGD